MTIGQAYDELDSVFDQFATQFGPPNSTYDLATGPGDVIDAVLELERSTKKSLSAAIRLFARTGQWSELSDDERRMLFYRINFGEHVLTILAHASAFTGTCLVPLNAEADREDWLEWLLVDMWEREGFLQLHNKVEDCLSSLYRPNLV